MTSWKHLLPAALTPAECQQLIAYATTQIPDTEGAIGYGGKNVIVNTFRRSRLRWLKREDPELQWLFTRMDQWVMSANARVFGFDVTGNFEVQFTEYHGSNAGKYDWHEDNSWLGTTPFDRKLSMSIQLSHAQTYSGGRMELAQGNLAEGEFCNQGDALIFPSFLRHRVLPVTSGVRYSLVSWWQGPRLR